MRICWILMLAAALPVAAQVPAEQPRKTENPPERRSLDLRLDNPSSFATIAPAEKEPKVLPTLGGDARPTSSGGANAPSRDPIPKDTNPGGR
ncbi:MAG TPA: hypothetical protein VN675_07305 [Burkholderiales bacterium]|nr:hypothetical protein [Burkholderiales bacterium]